jgi:hypothetical protein
MRYVLGLLLTFVSIVLRPVGFMSLPIALAYMTLFIIGSFLILSNSIWPKKK